MGTLLAATVLFVQAADALVCGPRATAFHRESSPSDVMGIENGSTPEWSILRAEILLAGSAGRLIFDTEPGGPGTSMSRPFRAAGGGAALAAEPETPDGSELLGLDFAAFASGQRFTFTIDLDDRVSGYAGSTVAVSEMTGATLRVTFVHADGGTETHEGLFDADPQAIAAAPCVS